VVKVKSRSKFIIVNLVLGIIISFSFFIIGYLNYQNPTLGNFKIKEITEQDSLLYLYATPSHNAITYKVTGINKQNEIIYEQDSDSNIILLNDLTLDYEEETIFKVTAYNKNDESIESENEYNFKFQELSFEKGMEHFSIKDQDFLVKFLGDSNKSSYTLDVYYEDLLLKSFPIIDNQATIPKELLNELSGKVTLKINKDNKRIINQFNIYANSPVVGNITITNMPNISDMIWDDVKIIYDGGVNATTLKINLYKNGIKEDSYYFENKPNNNSLILPASFFTENSTYIIELMAIYKDHIEVAKSDQITINIGAKETVKPIYVDYNYKNLKKGSKITFKSNTKDANIYFTLDGSEPDINSNLYKEPVLINEDATIKVKGIRKNMFDSEVNTYDFHVGEKPLVVYLSPSNQYANYGVKEVGYTTEKNMMNKLTDYLKPYLESYGVKVYRNNPNTDINTWTSESNYVRSDLHLAIHSNASQDKENHGIEMYIDNPTSQSLSIANKIYNNLYNIYPYKDEFSNRGIKYSGKSLGEANDSFIPCGTLIEVAYHDNYNDAKWMVENLKQIAENIGDSILEYYQVK